MIPALYTLHLKHWLVKPEWQDKKNKECYCQTKNSLLCVPPGRILYTLVTGTASVDSFTPGSSVLYCSVNVIQQIFNNNSCPLQTVYVVPRTCNNIFNLKLKVKIEHTNIMNLSKLYVTMTIWIRSHYNHMTSSMQVDTHMAHHNV